MVFFTVLTKVDRGNFYISSDNLKKELARDDLRLAQKKSQVLRDAYLGAAKGSSFSLPLRVLLGTGPESYNRALTGHFEAENGVLNYAISLSQKVLRNGLKFIGSLIGSMLNLVMPHQVNAARQGQHIGRRLGDAVGNEIGGLVAGTLGAAALLVQSAFCALGALIFISAGFWRKSWTQSDRAEELRKVCQDIFIEGWHARRESEDVGHLQVKVAKSMQNKLQKLRQEIDNLDVAAKRINERSPKPLFDIADRMAYDLIGFRC